MQLAVAVPVFAAEQTISVDPKSWRLQDYIGGTVNLWFTSSSCTYGGLSLVDATEAERNRLWALVLSAKLSSKKVFVYYDDAAAPAVCRITSFGIDE